MPKNLYIQLHGYLKTLFSNVHTRYGSKKHFADGIDHEAIKVQIDAHLHSNLFNKGIPLKTTQNYLKIFWKLYSAILKPICKS